MNAGFLTLASQPSTLDTQMIARVTLEIALGKEFDYWIPSDMENFVEVGSRVKVPFGRREVLGCVTAVLDKSPHESLKPISKIIGRQSLVTPKVLQLTRWIADYYCCPREIALKTVLPEAVRKEKSGWREQLFVRLLTPAGELPKLTKRQQDVWKVLEVRRELPLQELLKLAQTTAETVRRLEDKGLVSIANQISERDPYARENILPTQPLALNDEQASALKKITDAMDAPDRAAGVSPAERADQRDSFNQCEKPVETESVSTLPEAEYLSPFFKGHLPVQKFAGWLPHWRQADKLYFVTFRLADSVAESVLRAWTEEKKIWHQRHPEPWKEKDRIEYNRRFTARFEALLDQGHGRCVLAQPEVSAIVEDALRHFDNSRYQLGDYAIMPNHVHVLVRPHPEHSLEEILHSWKSFTAYEINARLRRTGTIWRDEYFDHLVRSEGQYQKVRRYIAENPIKARLVHGRFRVGCGTFIFASNTPAEVPAAGSAGKVRASGQGTPPRPFRRDAGSTFLLHGVTGSGKTEVYLQAIAHALAHGKGAIVLVPEISLTPQTVERFKARFSSGPLKTLVAVLHSHLSAGERHDEWHKIRQGRARIVIGARSAVFAPVDPLGLIIVDEEHEHSYKQEESPRYHARDVAVVRAQMENAVVVLGSATPCMESFYNAQRGKYALLELRTRADAKRLPIVRVVDMRMVMRKTKGPTIFSPQLHEAILKRLDRREQTMLFLNRRGFASALQCPQCGYVAQCPNCSVSLTYHRAAEKICCHICGHETKAPSVCPEPKCKNPQIRYQGLGTERVEAQLAKSFPHARVRRMDSDTLKRKEDYRTVLGDFRTGKIDILVGTQMIAKGLHFPNVTLVGIIYADLSLHMPDFRAGERTFQLLTQVAGRAGRGDVEGEVYVQAFTPFHPAIQFARRHDYAGFYEQEIEFREQLKYPPISRIALITLKGRNEEKVKFSAEHLKKELEKFTVAGAEREKGGQGEKESVELALDLPATAAVSVSDSPSVVLRDLVLLGPAPAPLARAETNYRYQIMLRTRQMSLLSQKLAELRKTLSLPEEVTIVIDIDPVDLS